MIPERNIKMMTIQSMTRLLYAPMLAFLTEKPPVEMVVKAWTTASYRGIPARHRQSTSAAVRPM